MRRAMLIGTVVMGIVGLTGSAWGVVAQPVKGAEERVPAAHEFRDPTNAALVYWQAFNMMTSDMWSNITKNYVADPVWRPDSVAIGEVVGQREHVEQIIRASRIRGVDWGVEWSRGCNANLPHLGRLRAASRTLAVDSRRLIADGDLDHAAERAAAIYRVSSHASPDGTLISSLVGAAICGIACSETEALLKDGRLTEKGKTEILEAAAWLDEQDPFSTRLALKGERRWTAVWLREQCRGNEAGKKAAGMLKDLMMDAEKNAELLTKLEKLDERGLNAELDKLDAYFAACLEAWDSPAAEARERIGALERGATEEKFGMLFVLLGPSLSKAYDSDQKARARMRDTVEQLRAFVPVGK